MLKKIQDLIKGCSGESIGETLVALLISSLALVLLAGAITTATRLVTTSTKSLKDYYSGNNEVEKRSESEKVKITPSPTLTMTSTSTDPRGLISLSDIAIKGYKNANTIGNIEIVAYDYSRAEGSP